MEAVSLLPLAAVLAAGLCVFLVRWPVSTALGLYAFLLPFDAVLVTAQKGSVNVHFTWLVGAATVVILFVVSILGRRFLHPPGVVAWTVLLVLWAVTTSIWAANTERAVFRLPLFGLLLLLYLASAVVRITDKELATIAALAILGGCFAAAISVYRFSAGQTWVSSKTELQRQAARRGTLWTEDRETNPNTLGATLILPLSLAAGQLLSSRDRRRRTLMIAAICILGAGICTTMSRGALVASAVVCLVYFWHSGAKLRTLLALAVPGVVIALMPETFFSRLAQSFGDRGAGRLDIWLIGLHSLREYGLFGAGIDNFRDAYNQYLYTGVNFKGFSRAPHNIYLGAAVELGAVGLGLLLASIAGHLRFSVRALRTAQDEVSRLQLLPYQAACLGLLTSGFFLDLLWETYFWLTLMLLITAARNLQNSQTAALEQSRQSRDFAPAEPVHLER